LLQTGYTRTLRTRIISSFFQTATWLCLS
jgi:hypothetical protein